MKVSFNFTKISAFIAIGIATANETISLVPKDYLNYLMIVLAVAQGVLQILAHLSPMPATEKIISEAKAKVESK